MPSKARKSAAAKPSTLKKVESGIVAVDALALNEWPVLNDYIKAVSEYVLKSPTLSLSSAKKAQIALSSGLGRALALDLANAILKLRPDSKSQPAFVAGERDVAGALRTVRADVSEAHELDGLRLAIEIKPVNLAVGRAIWNRFGDVRAFAVNIHLKFPFAVVGGVLVIPTFEWKAASKAELELLASGTANSVEGFAREVDEVAMEADEVAALAAAAKKRPLVKVETLPLIDRLSKRLARIGRRRIESDPAHLLEALALIVYDPETSTIDSSMPAVGSGLRWDEFVTGLAETYDLRFE